MRTIGIILGNITNSAGTERAVCNLANILQNMTDYNVVIISVHSIVGQCYFELDDKVLIEHLNLPSDSKLSRMKSYIQFPNKVNSLVEKHKITALIGTGHQFNILLFFTTNKVKKIACEHMNYMSAPVFSRFIRRISYLFLDAVICLTNKDAKNYNFIKKNKLFVIPNSISFNIPMPSALTEKRIICVGRLAKQKGWDFLINAAYKIKQELPDWHIDIFGTGEEKTALEKQMKKNGTQDYVTLRLPVQNIYEEFMHSGIMCETSRWEGLPMVLVEAQSCGLPIVGFDCPEGPADIIVDGQCGYLIPVGDIDLLTKKIIEIANNKELQIKMGKESYELSKRYATEVVSELWYKTINGVFKQ